MWQLYVPRTASRAQILAARACRSLYRAVTGRALALLREPADAANLIVLGSDTDCALCHDLMSDGTLPGFRCRVGSDDYELLSARRGDQRFLVLAAGRPRGYLYAVYDLFERRAGCRYFWDGDRIPRLPEIDLEGLRVLQRPRFQYRGLRYFAHRSLTRFQAEHWNWPQWRRELDWIVKKRLNVFMLRIGLDDLFQKAFSDVVAEDDPYQTNPPSHARSYHDRTLFWPLAYRARLRRRILRYAAALDLHHPEDVGAITHWYSRTPQSFVDSVKPTFLPGHGDTPETNRVWDIREDANMDRYFALTEAHIKHYGKPDLFHTIGVAERNYSPDRKINHQLKLYVYRRIIARLRKSYPDAPLWIGSWDFWMYWTPEEVRDLIAQLDPANTLLFDYTSDSCDELNNFTNWGVVGQHPWIFGIFHAFEPGSDIRGNYRAIERRLPLAAADPLCKGMVLWPENSHADTLMLEYFAAMSWDPSVSDIEAFVPRFCQARYPRLAEDMLSAWRDMLPLIRENYWKRNDPFWELCFLFAYDPRMLDLNPTNLVRGRHYRDAVAPCLPEAARALRTLAALDAEDRLDPLAERDLVDLARTAIGRAWYCAIFQLTDAMEQWRNGGQEAQALLDLGETVYRCGELLRTLLESHADYSMNDSLDGILAHPEANSRFESTLKGNAEVDYCRSFIFELFDALYLPELRCILDGVAKRIDSNDRSPWNLYRELEASLARIRDGYYGTALASHRPDRRMAAERRPAVLREAAGMLDTIASQR